MRKILIFMLLSALGTGFLQAQYQPEGGKFSTELQFAPFGNQPFSNAGFRGRYFLNEKLAFRLNLDLGADNQKANTPIFENSWGTITKGQIVYETSFSSFAITPGIEYHFANWERLSVYAGGEFLYGMQFVNSNYDKEYNTTYEDGSSGRAFHRTTDASGAMAYPTNDTYGDIVVYNRGGMTLGARLVTGFDFYIYKGLYIGAELGLGYIYTSFRKVTVKDITDYETPMMEPSHKEVELNYDNGSSSTGTFNINCEPRIRLGWRF